MVPQTGIDGCLQAPELLGHAFLDERAYGAVDDVTSNQYEVRVFGIDEVHPAGQFPPRIVVTDVQVAHHDNLVVMRQWLVGLQIQRHAYLILIMDIAVEEDAYHRHQDGSGRPSVLIEPRTGHKADETPQVEHKKQHHEIEHDEKARRAYLIESLCYR